MTPQIPETWHPHPTLPYLISTRWRVYRLPGKGCKEGRLIRPNGRQVLTSHEGNRAYRPIPDLLLEARTSHPTPVEPPRNVHPLTDPNPYRPHPTIPNLEVHPAGKARKTGSPDPYPTFFLRGYLRVQHEGHPYRLHNLVAHTFLSDRPPGATYARHRSTDRTDCSVDNLEWVPLYGEQKPPAEPTRPRERKSGRPMTPQQMFAILARRRQTR